ncbi:DUF6563 family protein [Spirosoma jeollabukense]
MNRFFTLLIFVLITSGPVLAQKSTIFYVPLEIDLTVSPSNRLFSIDTIVNARADTLSRIGIWQKPSGKIAELQLKGGFQPTLTSFAFSTLTNFDNKYPRYALVIQEFDINSTYENTRFELAVTFSKSSNSNRQLVPVYKADIIIDNTNASLTEVLKKGLAKAFLKFNEYLTDPSNVPAVHSDFVLEAAKAAQDLSLTKAAYDSARTDEDDLLRCTQLRPGIYQNFNELKRNRPSLIGDLNIQEKNNFATLRKPSGSRAKHRFFGYCNGKDLFISTGLYQTNTLIRRYARVKSVGRYLLWIDNYVTTGEMIGASFGLIGALASSASYKDCIALDMQTGGILMVTKDKLPQMLAGHDDLLAELAAMTNQKDEQQQFDLLDKLNQRSRTLATH